LLAVMDRDAREFVELIELSPWEATALPLPESLYDLDALRRLRPIVYAVIQALRIP
jgi:hypothetical protein